MADVPGVIGVKDLFGREAEFAALRELLEVPERLPAVATIAGPAGIGKTALWLAAIQVAESKGLVQVRDTATTEKWVDEALAANPNAVDSYKNNPKKKMASLGFLRGADDSMESDASDYEPDD